MTKERVWSYRDEPRTEIAHAVLWVLALSFLGVAVVSREAGTVLSVLVFAVFIMFSVLSKMAAFTSVEIDRREGTVKKADGLPFLRKQKTWSLRIFDSAKLIEKHVAIEDGYGVTCYTIVLEGEGEPLELLTTYDEQRGRSLQQELSEFLDSSKR